MKSISVYEKSFFINKQYITLAFSMTFPSNTYKKQNSFLGIRQHKTLEDIVPRIRNLKDRLPSLPLSGYKRSIIQSACFELLNEANLEDNSASLLQELERFIQGENVRA